MEKQYLPDLWKHPNYPNSRLKEQIEDREKWEARKIKKYKVLCWVYLLLGCGIGTYISIGNDGYAHPKVLPTMIVSFITAVLLLASAALVDWFANKKKPNTIVIDAYLADLKPLADQLTLSIEEIEQMDPKDISSKYIAPRMRNLQNFIDEKMRKHETAPAESDRLEKLKERSDRFQLLPKQ